VVDTLAGFELRVDPKSHGRLLLLDLLAGASGLFLSLGLETSPISFQLSPRSGPRRLVGFRPLFGGVVEFSTLVA
jgi:hypothetical protein